MLSLCAVLVFSVYKSLSTDEHNGIDAASSYHYETGSDIKLAQDKIRQLEARIRELEDRIPKKYGRVKFLNYQNRKRILVTGEDCCNFGGLWKGIEDFCLVFFRWCRIRWKSFSGFFNGTGELDGEKVN